VSWFRHRAASPPRPAPELGAAIVTASLRHVAEEYAKHHLTLGALIHEATDAEEIAPFRELLPAALARRGLCLVAVEGGWRVERTSFPSLAPLPCECATCHASIFDCGHGAGQTLYDATKE